MVPNFTRGAHFVGRMVAVVVLMVVVGLNVTLVTLNRKVASQEFQILNGNGYPHLVTTEHSRM